MSRLASGSNADVASIVAHSPKNIQAVTDDAPYFWHFSRFRDVIANIAHPLKTNDPEDAIGERVLLLLLGIAVLYAAVFLLAPFFAVRKKWRAAGEGHVGRVLRRARSRLHVLRDHDDPAARAIPRLPHLFAHRHARAAILLSTGVGALLSRRLVDRARIAVPILLAVLAALTLFYELALPSILDGRLLSTGLAVRVVFAGAILTPLGLCLGMFMPLGLGRVASLTEHGEEYVAWAWAVNGFFSVIGSVLTTILSMAIGFRTVQFAALAIYAVAVVAFTRLPTAAEHPTVSLEPRMQTVTV